VGGVVVPEQDLNEKESLFHASIVDCLLQQGLGVVERQRKAGAKEHPFVTAAFDRAEVQLQDSCTRAMVVEDFPAEERVVAPAFLLNVADFERMLDDAVGYKLFQRYMRHHQQSLLLQFYVAVREFQVCDLNLSFRFFLPSQPLPLDSYHRCHP
jgi:hypothetical protein